MKKTVILIISVVILLQSCNNKDKFILLSDLINNYNKQENHENNKQYIDSVLVASVSSIEVMLNGKCSRFTANIDFESSDESQSIDFVVVADGKELFNSNLAQKNDSIKTVDIDITGVKELILNTKSDISFFCDDCAIWSNAKFILIDSEAKLNITSITQTKSVFVKENLFPQINCPKVLEFKPNSPINYYIPVSGKRPFEFYSNKFPGTLEINKVTGLMSGYISKVGEYKIYVTVKKDTFATTEELILQIKKQPVYPPVMGWSSKLIYGADVSEDKIRKTISAMINKGLNNYGWKYINIDDGWQGERGGPFNAIMPNKKFKNMDSLVCDIHNKGLKAGIYSSPFIISPAGYTGSSADKMDGTVTNKVKKIGANLFVGLDSEQFKEWKFDLFKFEWSPADLKITKLIASEIEEHNRDIVLSIADNRSYANSNDFNNLADIYETTNYINNWSQLKNLFFDKKSLPEAKNKCRLMSGILYSDEKNEEGHSLTLNELYTKFSVFAMLSSPMIISCDVDSLNGFIFRLLTNRDFVAINQDITDKKPEIIKQTKDYEIWTKQLHDKSLVICTFNKSDKALDIDIYFLTLEIENRLNIRDLWQQKDMGSFEKKYSLKVAKHGVSIIIASSLI